MKIAHIYVSDAKQNSGDYMIGIATKRYFAETILKKDYKDCQFTSLNCRHADLYNSANITKLNEYDYILVGGGGLILPDSAPNKISAWQWIIPKENYSLIKKPIYVISIGYNLFYGQKITMPNRNNNAEDSSRYAIFKYNIEELIRHAASFSLRHHYDIEKLKEIVDISLHHKIKFEFCPTAWYSRVYHKPRLNFTKKYIAFEIKDDRPLRRYYKIGLDKFYQILLNVINKCLENNINVCYLSHDSSRKFYDYLIQNHIKIPFIDNSCANEIKIYNNYSKINKVVCTAGHSQMIADALGLEIISLITHPKLKAYCDDTNNSKYIIVNEDPDLENKLVKLILRK